jgi:nitrilase
MARIVRVAALQASPVFLDLEASVDKACSLIEQAGRSGVRLAVLPEAFLSGYPVWLQQLPPGDRQRNLRDLYAEMARNAVDLHGPALRAIGQTARAAGTFVVVGATERNTEASGGSLYNTLFYISDSGEVIGRHRKLVPTNSERLVWTPGDGAGIEALPTAVGRIGGLVCWENYMPLARFALYATGVEIYVAPTWSDSQTWLATLQHIAFEGNCYVIGCGQPMRLSDIPDRYDFKRLLAESGRGEWVRSGNSAVFGPGGVLLAGPLQHEEGMVSADIDLDALAAARASFDVAGHYARPDVFSSRSIAARAPCSASRTTRQTGIVAQIRSS